MKGMIRVILRNEVIEQLNKSLRLLSGFAESPGSEISLCDFEHRRS